MVQKRRIKVKADAPPKPHNNRTEKVTVLLTPAEKEILDFYIKKYRIENRSRHLRSLILKAVYTRLNKDFQPLFDDDDLD